MVESERLEEPPNLDWWNERAAFHRDTPLYQKHIERLRNGGLALLPLEVSELGELSGRRVLHTQCHIGTDTLSLARLGADVTGVDFSEVAIAEARQLSRDLGIFATFEVRELSALESEFSEAFDMVFTSHGVLTWLSDLSIWAEQLAGCLRKGGSFYMSEGHPLVWAFADKEPVDDSGLRLEHPYLSQPEPSTFVESGSYANRDAKTENNQTNEWSWGIGDVVNALIGAGMRIDWLNEHPLGFYPASDKFIEQDNGHCRLPDGLHGKYPLTFSIQATKI